MHRVVPARPAKADRSQPFPEPVSRLAAIRHSLRLVEPFGHGPADDVGQHADEAIAAAWGDAGPARRARFDRRSGQLVSAASAGLEALMVGLADGREPPREASAELSAQIRRELAEISSLILA